MSPAAYAAAIAAKKRIVGGNGVLTSDSSIERMRPLAVSGGIRIGGTVHCLACPSRCPT